MTQSSRSYLLDECPIVYNSRWNKKEFCSYEQSSISSFFTFELAPGDTLLKGERRVNYIVALVKGTGSAVTNLSNTVTATTENTEVQVATDEMLFIAADDSFLFKADTAVKGVALSFDVWPIDDIEMNGFSYGEKKLTIEKRCLKLPINEIVRCFWENLYSVITSSAMSPGLSIIKRKELFYYIYLLADKNERDAFLLPALNQKCSFRSLVLNNCDKVNDTEDLVRLSGMCRTNFYRRFKQEFNMPIYRWMQKRRAYAVRLSAAEPDMNVQKLMQKHQFSSASNFIRFCRMYYNCNPNELIRRARTGTSLLIEGEESHKDKEH